MIFEPIQKTDHLGRSITLRNAESSDAEALLAYMRITTAETPYLIREPDEIVMTLEQEEAFLQSKMEAERELLLIAEMDGRHIGSCSLMQVLPYKRFAHRCSIAIALYQEFCGAGIGEIMLSALLGAAKQVGYEQAELEVVSENRRAMALYEKLGFKMCGHLPNNMKYADGSYADAEWMVKKL